MGRRRIARCTEFAPKHRRRAEPHSVRPTARPAWVMSQGCFGELREGVWMINSAPRVKGDPTGIAAVDRINNEGKVQGRTNVLNHAPG